MNKRGQFLAAFVLIGLAVVASFAFLYYISYVQSGREFKPGVVSQISLTSETGAFKNYVQSCLEETTKEGLDYFGVLQTSQPLIEQYIRTELPKCIDFEAFKEFGMEIKTGAVEPRVKITDKSVLVDVTYPITIEKQGATATLDTFNYYLKRERSIQFTFDAQGTAEEYRMVTEDGDAELIIPQGTWAHDKDGHVLDEVTLKVLDRNFDSLSNSVVVGMIVYDGIPDGARFSPPVTLKINYDPNDLPPGTEESLLSIGYYDKGSGLWKSLPSTVDTANHIVSAQIYHFTKYATLRSDCQKPRGDSNWLSIPPGDGFELVFEQTCGKSYSAAKGVAEGSCLDVGEDWEEDDSDEYPYNYHEEDDLETPFSDNVFYILEPNPNPLADQIPNDMCGVDSNEDEEYEPVDWDGDDQEENELFECQGANCNEPDMTCAEQCKENARLSYEKVFEDQWQKFMSGDGIPDDAELLTCSAGEYNGEYIMLCGAFFPATPATYGYPEKGQEGAGGWGYLEFTIKPNSGGCVAVDENENVEVKIYADCDDDKCACSETDTTHSQNEDEQGKYCDGTENVDELGITYKNTFTFNPRWYNEDQTLEEPPDDADEDAWYDSGITSAYNNRLYLYIDPTEDDDGCAYGLLRLRIKGYGIEHVAKTYGIEIEEVPEGCLGISCNMGEKADVGEMCKQDNQGDVKLYQLFAECVGGCWQIVDKMESLDNPCPQEAGTQCDPLRERHRQRGYKGTGTQAACVARNLPVEVWERCRNGVWDEYPVNIPCGTNPYFPREQGAQRLPGEDIDTTPSIEPVSEEQSLCRCKSTPCEEAWNCAYINTNDRGWVPCDVSFCGQPAEKHTLCNNQGELACNLDNPKQVLICKESKIRIDGGPLTPALNWNHHKSCPEDQRCGIDDGGITCVSIPEETPTLLCGKEGELACNLDNPKEVLICKESKIRIDGGPLAPALNWNHHKFCAEDQRCGIDHREITCVSVLEETPEETCTDVDEDGFFAEGGNCGPVDCIDHNPFVNPSAEEGCSGLDTDCDGLTDCEDPDCNHLPECNINCQVNIIPCDGTVTDEDIPVVMSKIWCDGNIYQRSKRGKCGVCEIDCAALDESCDLTIPGCTGGGQSCPNSEGPGGSGRAAPGERKCIGDHLWRCEYEGTWLHIDCKSLGFNWICDDSTNDCMYQPS